mgnify:FL=1|jgi:predicted DNA-binding protein (UPF0251 family)|tara:strand:- start:11137 stop:11472 length:336 start_codon:yes stop_codon:yes gene_type:complete
MTELSEIDQILADYSVDLFGRSYYKRAVELTEDIRDVKQTLSRKELELGRILDEYFYMLPDAADMLGIGRSTLARHLNQKKIDGLRTNGKWFIPKTFVDEKTESEEWLNEF